MKKIYFIDFISDEGVNVEEYEKIMGDKIVECEPENWIDNPEFDWDTTIDGYDFWETVNENWIEHCKSDIVKYNR